MSWVISTDLNFLLNVFWDRLDASSFRLQLAKTKLAISDVCSRMLRSGSWRTTKISWQPDDELKENNEDQENVSKYRFLKWSAVFSVWRCVFIASTEHVYNLSQKLRHLRHHSHSICRHNSYIEWQIKKKSTSKLWKYVERRKARYGFIAKLNRFLAVSANDLHGSFLTTHK